MKRTEMVLVDAAKLTELIRSAGWLTRAASAAATFMPPVLDEDNEVDDAVLATRTHLYSSIVVTRNAVKALRHDAVSKAVRS